MESAQECIERLTLAAALLDRFEGATGGARYALEALQGSRTLAAALPRVRAVTMATGEAEEPQQGGNARLPDPPHVRPPVSGASLLSLLMEGKARAP